MSRPLHAASLAALLCAVLATACAGGEAPAETEVDLLLSDPEFLHAGDVGAIGRSGDQRIAWVLVDLLRFHQGQTRGPEIAAALSALTGVAGDPYEGSWVRYADDLLERDVPAPARYAARKREVFIAFDDDWAPFFDDDADVDWRAVTWGGVFRDALVTLDNPQVTGADGGAWLGDDEVVFGVEAGGVHRAYPRRVLDAHEIVNDAIGGTEIAITYCTLCGSAIAYERDGFDLRTTGLLLRSNKLMYETRGESMIHQFSGEALTGPLRGTALPRARLRVTTWGAWRAAHPATTVLAEDIAGRTYGPEPDRDGTPAFPVGVVDPRLDAATVVVGVRTPSGDAVAFDKRAAVAALAAGGAVRAAGVELRVRGGAVTARVLGGRALPSHEAYWFAWSQFHPRTAVWTPREG